MQPCTQTHVLMQLSICLAEAALKYESMAMLILAAYVANLF